MEKSFLGSAAAQVSRRLNRRRFLGRALQAVTSASALASFPRLAAGEEPREAKPAPSQRKIKLGVVGNGGRGAWIAKLFQEHSGYELHAVADYFPEVARQCGQELGVDANRRFSGLLGYQRLIESGVEAVVLETPPCFFPQHARAAVEAGLHVFMAKPVAVDVPGAMEILACGRRATERRRCFLVDYQIPTDPSNVQVAQRIRSGAIGKPSLIASRNFDEAWPDPPRTATIASRLRRLIWCNDIALCGSSLACSCIHAIDSVLWVLSQRPTSATGYSHIARPQPHGDSHDVFAVSFAFADGCVWDHSGRYLNNLHPFQCDALFHGTDGFAQVAYEGRIRLQGREDSYNGRVADLYRAGAVRNIAAFYRDVTEGHFENLTVPRAVDGALTVILGREAMMRRAPLTMDALLRENRRLELDLTGL